MYRNLLHFTTACYNDDDCEAYDYYNDDSVSPVAAAK